MALTPAGTKLLVILTIAGVLGGGGFYFYKHKPAAVTAAPAVEQVQPAPAVTPAAPAVQEAAPVTAPAPEPEKKPVKKHVAKVEKKHKPTSHGGGSVSHEPTHQTIKKDIEADALKELSKGGL